MLSVKINSFLELPDFPSNLAGSALRLCQVRTPMMSALLTPLKLLRVREKK